jgi:MFS family permease
MFSLGLGLMFAGIAIGPTLGGLLIHVTGQVISVFYAATAIHLLYAILVWTLIPESLTSSKMAASRRKHAVEMQGEITGAPVAVSILVRIKRIFKFLSPLAVFVPDKVGKGRNILHSQKRDWSLSLLAASYGFTMLILVRIYRIEFRITLS